jgi:hypothetical protein
MTFGVAQIFKPRSQRWLMMLLLAMAIAYSLTTLRRPILPLPIVSETQQIEQSPSILTLDRQAMYFSGARKEMALPYQQATAAVLQNQCRRVGLALGNGDYWEYPFWVLLNQSSIADRSAQVQLRHIGMTNASTSITNSFPETNLCAVIALHPVADPLPRGIPTDWQPWYQTTIQAPDADRESHQLIVLGPP